MSQEINSTVWRDKLVHLLLGDERNVIVPNAVSNALNVLAQRLTEDDEVELHPLITRTLIVTIRERGADGKPVNLDLNEVAEYIANEYFVDSDYAHVTVRNAIGEVK